MIRYFRFFGLQFISNSHEHPANVIYNITPTSKMINTAKREQEMRIILLPP